MKLRIRRFTSLLLTAFILVTMATTYMPVYASMGTGAAHCEHHATHDETCGYVEAVEGTPCTHTHDASCGYVEAVEGKPCAHVCTEESGCVTKACIHIHDAACGVGTTGDDPEEGTTDPASDATMTNDELGVPQSNHAPDAGACTHVCTEESGCLTVQCVHAHDGACGYVEAMEGHPCTHTHDDTCGYVEAVEGHDCMFICPLCDCNCTDKCEGPDTDANGCPVCAENWENCKGKAIQPVATEKLTIAWIPDSNYVETGKKAEIAVTGLLDSEVATSATVEITLSDEEAALLKELDSATFSIVEASEGFKTLRFTIEDGLLFEKTITVFSDGEAALEISADEDVTITFQPVNAVPTPKEELKMEALRFVTAEGTFIEVVEKGTIPSQTVGVLYSNGTAAPIPEKNAEPTFIFSYRLGNGPETVLNAEQLPFGLEAMPVIAVDKNAEGTEWIASIEEELPTQVLVANGKGGSIQQEVSWTLTPQEVVDYDLKQLTEADLSNYPGAKAAGWYYILPYAPQEGVVIEEKMDAALVRNIYWADNHNASGVRPNSLDGSCSLQYALGNGAYATLSEDGLAALGMENMPVIKNDDLGGGTWELSVAAGTLPVKIKNPDGSVYDVKWRMMPTDTISGYSMVEITEENKEYYPSVNNLGIYYVLQSSFSFTLRLNRGDTTLGSGMRAAFVEQFYFTAEYTGNKQVFQLEDMSDYIVITTPEGQDPDHPNLVKITVNNLWRYNVDNSRILYSIQEGLVEGGSFVSGSSNGKMELGTLPGGDYFAISYDNSDSPGYGGELSCVRNGGTINLTLTGLVDYTAYKQWLDGGTTIRPTAEMHLWRYRQGESYTTASVVRDENNDFVTLTLGEDTQTTPGNDDTHTIAFDNLSKYDPEGYPYVYVVREYLNGINSGAYEKVFGRVTEGTGTVTDVVEGQTDTTGALRDDGNTWLYNGGTLSNRKIGTLPVSVTKIWKASSFQSEFENVTVVLALQCRHKGSNDPWEDTGITYEMSDFYAENLAQSHTGSYSGYDESGNPLEYRWVEEKVLQDGKEVASKVDGEKRTFTLSQGGRDVKYDSISVVSEQNGIPHTEITNSIANTVNYTVIKKWEGGVEPAACTFALYRSISGGPMEKYVEFTLDGTVDTEPIALKSSDGRSLTMQEEPAWTVRISGLPEFDDEGRKYEYMVLETSGKPIDITTQMVGYDYESTIVNGPGSGNLILVRKEWIDDSDIQHRDPVTIGVYTKADNEKIAEVTLGTDEKGWYDLVGIGTREADEVYILETKVGEATVGDSENPQEPAAGAAVQYSTDHHEYEVTYSKDSYEQWPVLIATNRRLGNIDITVTKNWQDGDAQQRGALQDALEQAGLSLAVKLDFREEDAGALGYTMTRTGFGINDAGDTVSISNNPVAIQDDEGNPADSIQKIDLNSSQNGQKIYFFNLPKYDTAGASVRYDVSEVFVDSTGKVVADLNAYPEVAEAYQNYRLSFVEGPYVVGEKHAHDTQTFTLNNGLSGTKSVNWYCLWLDDYIYTEGNRPDIYLDIYATRHVLDGDGKVTTETTLYRADYKWEYDEETDTAVFWLCTLDGMPMYDELGYEIEYSATVHTTVNYEDFFYLPVRYSKEKDEKGEAIFATEAGLNDTSDTENQDRIHQVPDDADYALVSGNTFVFVIDGTLTYEGEKLWTNLPGSYPDEDLPKVTFALNRRVTGEGEDAWIKSFASLTVDHDDWAKLKKNDAYVFELLYEGQNVLGDDGKVIQQEGQSPLPRFNEKGKLYEYQLAESIEWSDTDAGTEGKPVTGTFSTTYLGQTITNNYKLGEASLMVKKLLTVPKGEKVYPAITMVLTRTYTTSDGASSQPETVRTLVWSAGDVKAAVEAAGGTETVTVEHIFTFEDLPVYAPNGSKYSYTVTEEKDELGGYDTWVAIGDVAAEDVNVEGNSLSSLTPNEETDVDVTFLNERQIQDQLTIEGGKEWRDLDNAFGLRPDELKLEITLEYRVPAQTGQGNLVNWTVIPKEDYTIEWQADPDDGNRWTYVIRDLPRYANNGMEYIYRVTETVPGHYRAVRIRVQTNADQKTEGDRTVTVLDLINTLESQVSFAKEWVDQDGKTITTDALGAGVEVEAMFALQVRADSGEWQDAKEYFKAVLSADALKKSGLDEYEYVQTIRGGFTDEAWKATYKYEKLPTSVKDRDGAVHTLAYRVEEKEVRVYFEGKQILVQLVPGDGPFQHEEEVENGTHVNRLKTTELTIKKVWQDAENAADTRPMVNGKWSVSFLIQRSTDEGKTWDNILVRTLTGSTGTITTAKRIVKGLPLYYLDADQKTISTCLYRVRELQPGAPTNPADMLPEHIVEEGGIFNDQYKPTYSEEDGTWTVTNKLVSGLTISKTVTGPADPEAEFHFTLTLGDTTVNGQHGDLNFTNGVAQFTLKAGQSVTVRDLAVASGTAYTVTETDAQGAVYTAYKTTVVTPTGSSSSTGVGNTATGTLSGENFNAVRFTNDFEKTIEIPVTKVWEDNNDALGKRPESVIIHLWADGKDTGKVLTLNATNGWKGKFVGLDKYQNGKQIQYTLTEDPVQDYETDIDGYTVTNIYTPGLIRLSITKVWADGNDQDGIRPDSITVELLMNGAETGRQLVLNADNNWTGDFRNLPEKDLDGNPIAYTVQEIDVPDGYQATVTGDATAGLTVTNTHEPATMEVKVTKVWDDGNDQDRIRPKEITVRLLADGVDTGKTLVLSKDNGWTGSFTGLAVYKAGIKIVYTVQEVDVPDGYQMTGIAGDAATGFVITNYHKPKPGTYPDYDPDPTPTPRPTPPHWYWPPHEYWPPWDLDDEPQTGDSTRLTLWLALGAFGLAGVVGTLLLTRKRKK